MITYLCISQAIHGTPRIFVLADSESMLTAVSLVGGGLEVGRCLPSSLQHFRKKSDLENVVTLPMCLGQEVRPPLALALPEAGNRPFAIVSSICVFVMASQNDVYVHMEIIREKYYS